METCNYLDIQTPTEVWEAILKLNPIPDDETFYEPFSGEQSLLNLIHTNKKYETEITRGTDAFDFDAKDDVTCIYTNPPFKALIPNKKGIKQYKNSVYYFLLHFVSSYPNLKRIGFLINAKSFCSLTPKRLAQLTQHGFTVSSITVMNCNYWYGIYYFILFDKTDNALVKVIEKTFLTK